MPGSSPPAGGISPSAPAEAEAIILPPEHWAAVQAANSGDGSSVIESAYDESTASLRTTIRDYRRVSGRTYHGQVGEAEYWGANDDQAQEALDIHHHTCLLMLGDKLSFAPVDSESQKVLDIGTGTGIWAIDFADRNPGCEVIGTDVSPIQPSWVPPNVKFEIDDCTRPWTYPDNTFDFIHVRWLVGSISDWTALFKEAYRCLKPGGYIESHEPSSMCESKGEPFGEKSALMQWGRIFVKGGVKFGRPFTVFEDELQKKGMEEAGFVEIEEKVLENPIGDWPEDPKQKEIGLFGRATFLEDPKGFVMFFAHALEWTNEEIEIYLMEFRRELKDPKNKPFYRHKIVWGRKPSE